MNLVDLVNNQLGGDMVGRIASLTGIGHNETKSAVEAGVPALLASVAGLASTPDGANRLNSTLESLDDRFVGNIGSALSGGGNAVIESGRGLLGTLLGNNLFSGLGSALSRFTGLGTGAITSLMGLLAPAVLGVLKGQKQRMGLDASGMANLLTGQRQNIVNSMPSGLGSMLSGLPGLSALTGLGTGARDVAGSVYGAGQRAANTAAAGTSYAARSAANAGSSAARWLVPVAIALAIAGLGWWIFSRSGPTNATATPPSRALAPSTGLTAATEEQVNRLSGQVKDVFTSATTSLNQITDQASAEAAVPKLRDLASQFDKLRMTTGSLPTAARDQIASLVKQSWPALQNTIEKAMAIPGIGDTLRPVVDQIRNSVQAFTTS